MSRQRQDYDHVIKLLVIGDSGEWALNGGSRAFFPLFGNARRPKLTNLSPPSSVVFRSASPFFGLFSASPGVGKTSLLLRFSEDSFTTSFISTIGWVPLPFRALVPSPPGTAEPEN